MVEGQTLAARSVLVAEDDENARFALGLLLRIRGHRVELAADGPEAIAKALAGLPEVIVLDINLPGCDGLAVARRLRAARGSGLLLIGLTGNHAITTTQVAAAGFDHFFIKPVDPDTLAGCVAGEPMEPPPG